MKSVATIRIVLLGGLLLGAAHGAAGSPQEASGEGVEFFEKRIRPVLVEHCYKCHSADSRKLKGGLTLDSAAGMIRGGDSGPSIVKGDPQASRLIRAIRYADEKLEMPPAGKLPNAVVRDFVTWVKIGAPDPRNNGTSVVRSAPVLDKIDSHWAFRPPTNPRAPRVKNEKWARTDIDRFILRGLEGGGLVPAPSADRRTLLRRVTFDLIGLPPTPEEVDAFEQDSSPDAFEKVVERLLASPHYGERWGRHWLDVARYADTAGYTFGERRFAYAYAYRDWVIRAFNEGLPYDEFIVRQLAADQLDLGEDRRALAAMGFLTVGRRFLNNKPDIIDDRIDVVGRGLMALTVSCARCHAHKYDPIPTQDYYSLYGVFASSIEPVELPLLKTNHDSKAYRAYARERRKREDSVVAFRNDRGAKLLRSLKSAGEIAKYLLAAHEMRDSHENDLKPMARKKKLNPEVLPRWWWFLKQSDTGRHPVFAAWHAIAKGEKGLPPGVRPEVADALEPVPKSMGETADRYGILLSEGLPERVRKELVEGVLFSSLDWLSNLFYPNGGPDRKRPEHLIDELFVDEDRKELGKLKKSIRELEFTHHGAPPRGMVLVDAPAPVSARVFIRGNPKNLGEEVPRWFLSVVSGSDRKPFGKGSGRLELAKAIASPNNPLTARVMVNRIWMHHFGEGLVRTPSDFGVRSDRPSHPELLDWLAYRFVQSGWSVKEMHRLIVRSAVYQQSGDGDPRGEGVDPQNLLLWRMNTRRLDLEAMRDSMLAVSGRLDRRIGGRSENLLSSRRRTLYGYLNRQELLNVYRTFDFAIPDTHSPRRPSTTVPQQALYLMNSRFVMEQAKALASRKDVVSAGDRIGELYRIAFGRSPSERERERARAFVGGKASPARWAEFAQVLLQSNEFVFVD